MSPSRLFLGERVRAATSLTSPTKPSPKSFYFPVSIAKKWSGGVYRLHGQGEGIDCRHAGYRFQQLSVIALQRSAVRRGDPGAPFSGRFLERRIRRLGEKTPQRSQHDGRLSLLPIPTDRQVGPSRFPCGWQQVANRSRLASGSVGSLASVQNARFLRY